MKAQGSVPSVGSARTARLVGVALGLIISIGLIWTIVLDRDARVEAARRQSTAIAIGVDRLLHYEIRNLERALRGMAADADNLAAGTPEPGRDLSAIIRGVISRQPELQDIDLYAADGQPVHEGVTAASRKLPIDVLGTTQPGDFIVWELQRFGRMEPVVPLILRTPAGNWLVARLRTSELKRMLRDLDVGERGSAAILDQNGVVLAREAGSGNHVGRTVPLPDELEPGGTVQREMTSQLDGVRRFASFSATSGYPFVVSAGIARRDAMAAWRGYAANAAGVLALCWLGVIYLIRKMAAAETARNRSHQELQQHADWLAKAQEASLAGVWAMEKDADHVRASAHAAGLFGFPSVAGLLPVEQFFERMHAQDRERVEQAFCRAWDTGEPFHSEYRIVLPDGRLRWISARGAPARDTRDAPQMTGTIVDTTDMRVQQDQLERAETQFRELFELNPLPFWVFDIESLRFLAVNETAVRRYGYSREEFLRMTILQIRPPDEAGAVQESVTDALEPRDSSRVWVHATRDGRRLHVRVYSSSIRFNERDARLVLAEDVSDRVAYESHLAWRAEHDESTGLLNLRTLLERIDQTHAGVADEALYAIAYVQLRDLDLVSPTFGRSTRDQIIAGMARRFDAVAAPHGLLAYVPADAFVISARNAERWNELVDDITAALSATVESDSGSHRMEAWIGIAFQQRADQPAEDVVDHAALAALQARTENTATMHYSERMADTAGNRLALIERLRRALPGDEFELFFQPIRRVRDGKIVSAEALLRWRADGSYVPPSTFIPLSEESGLIVPIGEWVVDKAAEARRVLAESGHPDIAIAVNVSAVQFMSGSVPRALREAHERHGLRRGALEVELTESAMLRRPEMARAAMEELQDDGVCISIDDFGTGFSSMAYLRDLSIDHLKIDRSFVQHVHRDARNASICRALIALGQGLGLSIVAEGIETDEELDWMVQHGVDLVQGYHIARPAPLDEFLRWLSSNAG